MTTKKELYNKCQDILNRKLKIIQQNISDMEEGLKSDTKSSAGDKHETGRAMIQIEREKVGNQLAEIQKQYQILNKINVDIEQKSVALGSVVYTSKLNYFIAVSLGEIKWNDESFFAISPITPMAKLLLSKQQGDTFDFNSETIKITDLY